MKCYFFSQDRETFFSFNYISVLFAIIVYFVSGKKRMETELYYCEEIFMHQVILNFWTECNISQQSPLAVLIEYSALYFNFKVLRTIIASGLTKLTRPVIPTAISSMKKKNQFHIENKY